MNDPVTGAPTGRRRFLALVGLASLSTLLPGREAALAQTTGAPAQPLPLPPIPVTPASEGISEDAKALAGIVRRRYGAHLDDAMMKDVTEELENRLQGGRRLRGVRLANSDEPDFTFHP